LSFVGRGVAVRLERLPLEFLLLLVSRKGEVVTRDEIAQKLWGNDVYVDTNTAVNVVLRKARQALRDDAYSPKFLLTVTGKGYRFVGTLAEEPLAVTPNAVEAEPASATEHPVATSPSQTQRSWLRPWMALAALGLLVVTIVVLARTYWRRPAHTPAHRIMLGVLKVAMAVPPGVYFIFRVFAQISDQQSLLHGVVSCELN
jgi:DNA-binding winged helix-turn-helix (wHTH) protein